VDNTFRLTPPPSGDIKMPVIPSFTTQKLPNGAMLHVMPGGNQSIVKFEVCVSAGSLRCDRALVASATSELLTEGSQRHTAQEIAESLEQLRWIENGYRIKVGISDVETIGIDTPQDLQRAEEFLKTTPMPI